MQDDPAETVNLYLDEPATVARLSKLVDTWIAQSRSDER